MITNTLLAGLSAGDLKSLEPYIDDVMMGRGQPLLEIDRPIDYVWFPHDAVTSTVVDTAEGTTIEVGLMGMEGMVGLSLVLGTKLSNATVIVQIAGTGRRMRADHFVEHVVKADHPLHLRLLRYTNAFMAMVAQTAACNSLHDIDERLARWILMIHDRVQTDEMALTQEFLAYMLGVRRASVSIAASGLQAQGIIKYSRGNLVVLDRARLENACCACYAIVARIMGEPKEKRLSA